MRRDLSILLAAFLLPGLMAPAQAAQRRPWLGTMTRPAPRLQRSISVPAVPVPLPPLSYRKKMVDGILVPLPPKRKLAAAKRMKSVHASQKKSVRKIRKKPPIPSPRVQREVVHEAMEYKGVRYCFGGISKKGIDCSAFVKKVYEKIHSYTLPRTAADLYHRGVPIQRHELKTGDLIFFRNTYKRGISHVGIYLGDGRFIHASAHARRVTVSKMELGYYRAHYAGARRYIGA